MIDNVANPGSLFDYYSGSNTELVAPVTITSVRMIQLTLEVNVNSGNNPSSVSVSTMVSLRNMKDNL